ncbi:MAG: adenosylcobinamide-phosphate synthase CbiB [Gemmobacter sp.]
MEMIGLAALAMLLELAVGYPPALYARIGHPVTWIGALIDRLDRRWNRPDRSAAARRRAGAGVAAILLAISAAAGLALTLIADRGGWPGLAVVAVLVSSLIAQRSLHAHVADVARALETGGLAAGRLAVAQIVGRDPDRLDEAGVARAAIESLAENFSDGIVAPVLWLALLGPAGAIGYKAINTADSMIGHRTPRHADFGRAAARLDDLVNLPASRLSAALVVLAAAVMPGASPAGALRAVVRDARHHRSPNAGWPEAAMAGALGLGLAGPRAYGGVMTTDRVMNDGGRRALTAADIRSALALYRVADALLLCGLCGLALAAG